MQNPDMQLKQAAHSGQVVFFLGAGASRTMAENAPLWSDLAEGMVTYFEQQGEFGARLAERARSQFAKHPDDPKFALSQLEEGNAPLFYEGIRRVLQPALTPAGNGVGLPQLLAIIQPAVILTLSWDRLLDKTGDYELLTWRDEMRQGWDLRSRHLCGARTLYHLHGHVSRPDTLIATNRSYNMLYNTETVGNLRRITGFKQTPAGLSRLFSDDEVHVVVIGVNPAGGEFAAILEASLAEESSALFHIVAERERLDHFTEALRNRPLGARLRWQGYGYARGEHHQVLEFIARLTGRSDGIRQWLDQSNPCWRPLYRVYPNEMRADYLYEQARLEEMAAEVWYATPCFTNVFGSDQYLRSAALAAASKACTQPTPTEVDAIYESMLHRRNVMLTGAQCGRIKAVRCMYWQETEDTAARIALARDSFKNPAEFSVKKLAINAYPDDSPPGLGPSFAVVIGNQSAPYRIALYHAHQANASKASFQWLHVNTPTAEERLAWFARAWQSAVEVEPSQRR